MTDPRRSLPSMDAVLRASGERGGVRQRLRAAARDVLNEARGDGTSPAAAEVAAQARALLLERDAPSLRRVLNATGVVLHTNLGRAPLSAAALEAIADVAGTASVEYDLVSGRRGERHGHAARLLIELTSAEDGLVVNNGAAGILLALAALAGRREVVVARGELVEIGGSFRIPDVLARSGAKLVEVGTTNRTYAGDYASAITPRTAAILRVHASNFKIVGFTTRAESAELATIAHHRGIMFVHDLGSGTLLDTSVFGLGREETVQEAVAAGADAVTFSGDKLLGGPQAGIAVGSAAALARMRGHPLMRALRPDKLTLAALVATLGAYRDGRAEIDLPVWRMIGATSAALERRALALAQLLADDGVDAEVIETRSTVGGGSLPEETQPSHAVAIRAASARGAAARLRAASPAVVGRIDERRLVLDLRTVLPEDDEPLARAVRAALRA